ncbi:hypothetical protein [Luteibaculum oceani]|uniref:DUF4214 domain-containing protein n=1 Tax=Luteibaculum oceani TaxID=1294296 RepID=A0A5C6VE49_9FLAO|nr:hypothetical protein [Luteibaculum oceani]TXC82045.1 hypothetical protein FRX97_02835 [Luteibaculum oceani]
MKRHHLLFYFTTLLLLVFACGKSKDNVIKNNTIPAYSEVPTIAIENYVNRLFIDLVGREPADTELTKYVNYLKSNDLNGASRDSLIHFIQVDSTPRALGKYNEAYCIWLYEKAKNRFFLELGNDADFRAAINTIVSEDGAQDTLDSALSGFARIEIRKLARVLNSKDRFCKGEIGINHMMGYMINNANYDEINMQNVNFVRACFNDLFYRIINDDVLNNYAQALNKNEVAYVFSKPFSNKDEFVNNLIHSWEFYDGLATWLYLTYLQRKPSSEESFQVIEMLNGNSKKKNFQKIQRKLMITDEYAQFKYLGQ